MTQGNPQRPPAGMPLAEFFEAWLPETFAATGRHAPSDAPRVRASISGEGGGAWDVAAEDGALVVSPAGRTPPGLWVRQSARDLQAALWGDEDLPDLLPPGWSALDLLFLDERDLELVRRISGRVAVELSGKRGRRWAVDVALGPAGVGAGRPRTVIKVAAPIYESVLAGRTPAMEPLLAGHIKIDGDRALAMQLLLLLASRLGRS